MDIREANGVLKAGGCRVVVEERGGHLWLRGTLPPKPGSEKQLAHQQRIRLGVRATVAGLQYVQEYFEVPEGLVPWKGDLSIVSVYGDSMEPTYRHGDLVIVQPESRVMDAIMVVAWDDALMVKRVRRVGVKTIELISDNECYRPITLAVNEIRVVGRVMGLIRWNA